MPLALLWGYLRPTSPQNTRVQMRFSDAVWSPQAGFYGTPFPADFWVWQRPASAGGQQIWRGTYMIPPGPGALDYCSVHLEPASGAAREFVGEAFLEYSPSDPSFRGLHTSPMLPGKWEIGSE